ncbi:uncharacterized protein PF3D7_1120000 [Drosophila bipectinata]|uniref:uncharacterized protein PF3D7_1120000 n=1 Tax=Drosophila bipectinata TaxID=42026 RepID=UPI001C8AAD9B|nr:uncharacterized protein LOC108132995 [Drosophila bipectinata]
MLSMTSLLSQPQFSHLTATWSYFRTIISASRLPKSNFSKLSPSNRKGSYTLRPLFLRRDRNISLGNKLNDKFSEKGRGDELNYFLKLAREQLSKMRADRISEISQDIEHLNEEINKLEKNSNEKSKELRDKLLQDIQDLKGLLEQFKKSLEHDKEGK